MYIVFQPEWIDWTGLFGDLGLKRLVDINRSMDGTDEDAVRPQTFLKLNFTEEMTFTDLAVS